MQRPADSEKVPLSDFWALSPFLNVPITMLVLHTSNEPSFDLGCMLKYTNLTHEKLTSNRLGVPDWRSFNGIDRPSSW